MEGAVEELERAAALCGWIHALDEKTAGDAELKTALLEPLSCFVRADMGVFRVFSAARSTTRPVKVFSIGIPDRVNEAYLTRYFKLDPARYVLRQRLSAPRFANEREPGGWLQERGQGGLAPAAAPDRYRQDFLRYRSEFLLPNRFFHHLGFCFQDIDRNRTFLFDFHRVNESAPFGRLELARARLIAALLQEKLTRLQALDEPLGAECGRTIPAALRRLGTREREAAEAVAIGLTNKEIATRMSITVRTVENHMRSIFTKLGVTTRTRLAAKLHQARGAPAVASSSVV
jgi:DNA-binding CsgD family transcriptional regulator